VEVVAGVGNLVSDSLMSYVWNSGFVNDWDSVADWLGSLHAHFILN
jgi:hypothetical protein